MALPGWHDIATASHDCEGRGLSHLPVAAAKIGPAGIVRGITDGGRRAWGWEEGSRLPNTLRIALSEFDHGAVRMVPMSPGGSLLLAVRYDVAGGWILLDAIETEPDITTDSSGFRSLIEKMPVCVTALLQDGTVIFANDEASSFTGYRIAEMEGRPFWTDAVHPEDRSKLTEALRRVRQEERSSVTVRFLSKDRGPRLAAVHLCMASAGRREVIECVAFDVTERSEVEEALFQSEALYRIFLEQSPVGMLHVDAAATVTFENHQFRQITGESVEDAWIGRSITEIEGLDAHAKRLVHRLLAKGEAFRGETVPFRQHRDGIRHLQLHGSPRHHPEGGIVGGVLMVEDKSEERRRKHELDLRSTYASAESDLRKAALSDRGQQSFLSEAAEIFGESTGADLVYMLMNNAADDCCSHRARWLRAGMTEAEPVVVLHGEEPLFREFIADRRIVHASAQNGGVRTERLLKKTGAHEAIWMPFFDEARFAGFVVIERVDVTGDGHPTTWRSTERQLVEQLVRLFETLWSWMLAGSRFRHITGTIDDCLFTYTFDEDGERRFLFATPQIEALTGYSAEEIISLDGSARRWSDLIVHEDDQSVVDAHDESLKEGYEGRTSYRVRHRDGTDRWLQEKATPETDGMGDVIVNGILADVTEQKAAEEVLTDAKQQAESANRLKSAFIATMSHEIRTPMGAVNGFAELLTKELADLELEGVDIPPQVIEFLDAIRDNSKRLLTLVNDLFDLSNLEVGSIDLNRSAVPLHEIVMRSTSKVAVRLSQKGVDLRVELAEEDPTVQADAQRLEQIVDNLLSNAVKFTQEGMVGVRTYVEDEWVVTEVVDTGVGMSPSHLGRLFEPFVQEDSRLNRKFEGSGLGLSLVKRLADLMDGRIEVESEKGKGSTFRVLFPRHKRRAHTQGRQYGD